jgi:hypothetical protein
MLFIHPLQKNITPVANERYSLKAFVYRFFGAACHRTSAAGSPLRARETSNLFLMVSSGSPEHVSRKRVLDPLTLAFQKGFAAKIFRAHPDSTESRRALAA